MEIPRTSLEKVDLEATLGLILKNAARALGGGAGVVAIWSEAEHRFVISASYGLSARALARLRPLLDEAAPDLAGSRHAFALVSELRPDLGLLDSETGARQDPIIALPLQIAGRSMGLIIILRPLDAGAFTRMDQPTLAAFAEQAAIAVQNARLAHLLSEEKRRIEMVLETSAEGIMSIDSQRRIIGFNAAMERLTGQSRKDVLGKECFRALNFRDRDRKGICPVDCPFLAEHQVPAGFEREGVIATRGGRDVDVAMVYSIVRSPEGRPVSAVVNVRDISRLRETENLRETFLSMLGHELQTPLSIIKGYTSTLARADACWSEETLRKSLRMIEQESDRLSQVMGRLLLASRIASGPVLAREPTDVASIANKVVRRFQGLTAKHALSASFAPGFPAISVEPRLIEEVFTNLVDNAVKYSPRGGRVTIEGRVDSGQARITVSDEGVGIPESELPRVFERFHRIPATAGNVPGVGLGLYICKSIVEAHGGRIEVASRPGQGTRFIIRLPLDEVK